MANSILLAQRPHLMNMQPLELRSVGIIQRQLQSRIAQRRKFTVAGCLGAHMTERERRSHFSCDDQGCGIRGMMNDIVFPRSDAVGEKVD